MWPWSKIKSLETALQGCKTTRERLDEKFIELNRECTRVSNERHELRRQLASACEERDEARSLINKAKLERDQAQQGNIALQNRIDDLVMQIKAHQNMEVHYQGNALEYRRTIADLQTKLAEAAKNDTRDPKTGRFVKAS